MKCGWLLGQGHVVRVGFEGRNLVAATLLNIAFAELLLGRRH
ncbi:hypothetical protein HmCmsJML023_03276 [Escherichia coli]|nr:hypothetical protein HmCmsJML023_03276 [Escherichia coli]